MRDGVDSKMNPYDFGGSLETALKLREEKGGTITVIRHGTATGGGGDQRSICDGGQTRGFCCPTGNLAGRTYCIPAIRFLRNQKGGTFLI